MFIYTLKICENFVYNFYILLSTNKYIPKSEAKNITSINPSVVSINPSVGKKPVSGLGPWGTQNPPKIKMQKSKGLSLIR